MSTFSAVVESRKLGETDHMPISPGRSLIDDRTGYRAPDSAASAIYMTGNDNGIGVNKDAIKGPSYGDILWDKIYLIPDNIAAGFIVNQSVHEIILWNAYPYSSKNITDIVGLNASGTALPLPRFPKKIPALGSYEHNLVIYKNGPPIQDTRYNYTVDGNMLTLTIQGIRVVAFGWEHNWRNNLTVKLNHSTALYRNSSFVEQRRPMISFPLRGQEIEVLLQDQYGQRLLNVLEYCQEKIFGVPVFTEPMTPTGALTGNSSFTVAEDLTWYWHVQNYTRYVVIIDYATGERALFEIQTRVGSTFTLTSTITEIFNPLTTVVYPAFMGVVNSFGVDNESNTIMKFDIDFNEVNLG